MMIINNVMMMIPLIISPSENCLRIHRSRARKPCGGEPSTWCELPKRVRALIRPHSARALCGLPRRPPCRLQCGTTDGVATRLCEAPPVAAPCRAPHSVPKALRFRAQVQCSARLWKPSSVRRATCPCPHLVKAHWCLNES